MCHLSLGSPFQSCLSNGFYQQTLSFIIFFSCVHIAIGPVQYISKFVYYIFSFVVYTLFFKVISL